MTDLAQRLAALPPEKRLLLELRRSKGIPLPPGPGAEDPAPPAVRPFELISAADRSRLPADAEDAYPLSMMQAAMLYHMDLGPEYLLYHNVDSYHLEGPFEPGAFERAVQRAVARHAVLRTSFDLHSYSEPLQVVHRTAYLRVRVEDLRSHCDEEQQRIIDGYVEEEKRNPFDRSRPPLLRFCVHVRSATTFQFTLTEFHPIFDGWSLSSTMVEIVGYYASLLRGEPLPDLPPPRTSYRDFIRLEREALESEECRRYWQRALSESAIMELPRWPAPYRRVEGRPVVTLSRPIDPAIYAGLKQLASAASVPLKSIFMAVHMKVMGLLAGQDDVITGLISHGRPEGADAEQVRGLFLNTLPFRLRLAPGSWIDLARAAFAAESEMLPYRRFPMPAIQRSWGARRLFEVEFNITNFHNQRADVGIDLRHLGSRELEEASFPLCVCFNIDARWDHLRLIFPYHCSELCAPQMSAVVGYYVRTLAEVAAQPSTRHDRYSPLTPGERQQLLVEWNDSAAGYPAQRCVHELFAALAERQPDARAAACGGHRLSYGELDRRAERLAGALAARGVGPDQVVALLARRGLEFLTAILAVFKAGGAYLPLDPRYPAVRLAQVLERSGARLVLAEGELEPALAEAAALVAPGRLPRWERLEDLLEREAADGGTAAPSGPRNLAYVIYTSGSTATPKGAMVEHRGMLNHLYAKIAALGLGGGDVVAQTASQCFDISVWQFLAPLLAGGSSQIADDETVHDPALLLDLLQRERVSIFETVPSLLGALLDEIERRERRPELPALRWVIPTGEPLPPGLSRRWFEAYPTIPLLNAYGPTECSDDVSHHRLAGPPAAEVTTAPIGRAVANTRLYVLDREFQPLPVAVVGELCVVGDGVGRGYLNDPARTAEVFVPDPLGGEPGGRLYRTGDRARWLPVGELEFLGRLDQQVKVRGFRIEPGEIEAALAHHPAVRDAVVVAWGEAGDRRLVAYLTTSPAEPRPVPPELRGFLARTLPDYMLPSAFVTLEALPLTPNGKLDRRALPPPEAAHLAAEPVVGADDALPLSPYEELLAEIWKAVLGVERVGRRDGFFDLGGHSLLATQLISRVREAFGIELPLRSLFDAPTLGELARRVEAAVRAGGEPEAPPIEPIPRDGELPLSFAQERLWFLDQLEPGGAAYNIPTALIVTGDLDAAVFRRALGALVQRHESLRTSFLTIDGRPLQVIHPAERWAVPHIDLEGLPKPVREAEMRRLASEEARTPFDLAAGPLLRVRLLRLTSREHAVFFTIHHIVSDGWSTAILVREVAQLYEALAADLPSPLPELPVQYVDFAAWQRTRLQGRLLEHEVSYWRRRLSAAPELLELPIDRPRPARPSLAGATWTLRLSPQLSQALAELGRGEGATLFMTLLAAFQALLYRETGQTDVVVGTDVANRTRSELEGILGFFVNHLVLRTDFAGRPTFRGLLRQVRETCLEAYAHQEQPFVKLVSTLQPKRSLSHMPLFQVLFVLQNAPASRLDLPGLTLQQLPVDVQVARFDLALFANETDEGLLAQWIYSTELFDASTIAGLSQRLERLLASATQEPDARVDSLDLLTDRERKQRMIEAKQRQESKLSSLRSGRRRAVDLAGIQPVREGYLGAAPGMPLVLEPVADLDLLEWAEGQREVLERQLHRHGAILFRGFGLKSAAEFERFAQALCPDLFSEYGDLPPEEGQKVYQSTPYPSDKTILFHNESSHMHRWPLKQWFFCLKAAETGGETPIVDGRTIYRRLDPELRRCFESVGLLYLRNFTDGLDVSWQSFFKTSDRAAVERFCSQAGIDFEWTGSGLRTRQLCPAVAVHPKTGDKSFFNQIQLHHVSCLEPEVRASMLAVFAPEDLPRSVCYGDGSPIDDAVVQEILDLYWQEAVSFPWQEGDVLMVDNMLTAHARRPFTGARKIVVAMGELTYKDAQA